MAVSNIADELMSSVIQSNYCEYVQCLSERDAVNIQTFQYTPMGKNYWIDLRRCFINSKPNQNHVLELFGEFSGFEPSELRQRAVTILSSETEIPYWSHAGSVLLGLNFMSYSDWLKYMSEDSSPCDELMLYVLNRIHCRHTVVFTSNRIWTTVQADNKLTEEDLLSICDLRLVYLGNKIFGELKKLPMCTPPPPQVLQSTSKKSTKTARKGKALTTPLNRSIKSLQDKRKMRPRTNASGGAIIEKQSCKPVTSTIVKEAPLQCLVEPTTNSEKQEYGFPLIKSSRRTNSSIMATPVADVPSGTSPCLQPSDEHTVEPGLNFSNVASSVADVPSRMSPWPLRSDSQSNSTIEDIAVPSLNSSNSIPSPSAAEVPLVSPLTPKVARNEEFQSPIAADADGHLSCRTINQSGLCLNSSNSILPLSSKSPESLCTLVRSYMVSTMFLDICEIDKYMLTLEKLAVKMPSSLKTIVTNYICKHQPSIDLDDALTGILKTNILKKYEIRTEETALELDLNTLLKNLALKQKPKVIVPKIDKVTLLRLTKVVPHWSELDPYSDLEEHCESGNASPCEPVSPDCAYFTKIGGHVLRK